MDNTFHITKRGRALAWLLNPYMGTTSYIAGICSAISRLARTYGRLQEWQCDHVLTDDEEAREARIEARIKELVSMLPHTDHGPITVRFSGDPRGYTVKLHVPGVPQDGNTWGLDGDFGVEGS